MILGIPLFLAITAFVFVIFVHELGHYLVGRLCGIGASVFSIGFGPKLFSYTDRNKTEWMVCLLPLGGYVKFLTKDEIRYREDQLKINISTDSLNLAKQGSFTESSLLARSLTVLAGPFANFLMAVFIFASLSQIAGTPSNDPIIGKVAKLPEAQISLAVGDRILSIEGKEVKKFSQVYDIVSNIDKLSNINFRVERNGQSFDLIIRHLFPPVVSNTRNRLVAAPTQC